MAPSCSNYFYASDADLILRSSDPATDFHVHRLILSLASPFFHHMFQLPQPPCDDNLQPPVVNVSETMDIIEALLRIIYPGMPDPTFDDFDRLILVLHAAVKYDMPSAIDSLRKRLVAEQFVTRWPMRVYAIATRYDLEEEAKIASRHTLSVNLIDCPLSEELKYITAFSYHRLLVLHHARARAAQEVLKIQEDVKCMECNGAYGAFSAGPKWWLDFERRAKEELSFRPTSDVVFSMKFVSISGQVVGCKKCAGSILDSWSFLENLKRKIDDLPATI